MTEMETKGIRVKLATEDADIIIVKITKSKVGEFDCVTITEEDIGLLVVTCPLFCIDPG